MLADLMKIYETSAYWRALEEEWRRENAGCCDSCGRTIARTVLRSTCVLCAKHVKSLLSWPKDGARLSRPNAAWKRHDREVREALAAFGGGTLHQDLEFSRSVKEALREVGQELFNQEPNAYNAPLPPSQRLLIRAYHPAWPKDLR